MKKESFLSFSDNQLKTTTSIYNPPRYRSRSPVSVLEKAKNRFFSYESVIIKSIPINEKSNFPLIQSASARPIR